LSYSRRAGTYIAKGSKYSIRIFDFLAKEEDVLQILKGRKRGLREEFDDRIEGGEILFNIRFEGR